MSIITVIDQNTDNVACIDREDFTANIVSWFGDSAATLDESIRQQFLDLASIIESGEAWTDEEAGELARFLGLTIEFGTVDAELEIPADNDGIDTIVITLPYADVTPQMCGQEIARIQVDASEDQEPYDRALRAAGIAHVNWI